MPGISMLKTELRVVLKWASSLLAPNS